MGEETGVLPPVLLPCPDKGNGWPTPLVSCIVSGLPKKPSLISISVGYGRLGSPCSHVRGAQTAFDAEIRWAYLMSSSEGTGFSFALSIESSFCLAWKIAVDKSVSAS